MPESQALMAYDIGFAIHDGEDPGNFEDLAEVNEITPPNQQADDIDVTHQKSPGKTREYIAGMIEPGDMTVSLNWIPGSPTDLVIQSLKASGARRRMRIAWNNGIAWTFTGYIKGFEPSTALGDKMTGTVTIKVAGSTEISGMGG
ncbi:phage tail tube protein [Rhodovulum sp. YEN HP10]|uniref:phage tail tube protein n=1 Tax=Rhodovulum sp. HP10 TaxID=3387397 RepID=UPI0039E0892F